jgi:glycosylphosphatidylinositol transamidase (GPIT) subunit GPI8
MNQIYKICLLLAAVALMLGCDDHNLEEERVVRKVKIAVVLPEASHDRWERIMDLAEKNISEATDIQPVFEFYDENSQDVMNLAYNLANDESVVSVIGCEGEANTEALAYQMSRLNKPKPMFTFNTSQELIRKYARMGFMWGFSESDITQSEVLLAQIASDFINREVALIASNSSYGQTFVDWFAFQTAELGLTPLKICTYSHVSEIAPLLEDLSTLYCPIVCVPDSPAEAAEMVKHTYGGYFSHKAFNQKTLDILKESGSINEYNMRGITMVPNPSSGFQDIYEARFGQVPIFGEAPLYDAIMVTCLAYALAAETGTSLNQAVSDLFSVESHQLGGWTRDGIQMAFNQIVNSHTVPAISGAIGKFTFSPEQHTINNYSTYAVQYMAYGKFYQTDFVSRGGKVSSSEHGAWMWNKLFDQDFDHTMTDANLKPCEGNKAVLISTSSGWNNYRHQADILAYYQELKKNGFTDDELILIMADDLAFDSKNPYPGQIIRNNKSLENLYSDVKIDYKLDQISPLDLKNILLGKSNEKLPVVLDSDDSDNVLLLWSGHGAPGTLLWDENQKTITGDFMSDLFNEMYAAGKYRKLFGIIEACYAGSVAAKCKGVPNLLLMTAANDKETSKAELYAPLWNTYLSNSFTMAMLETLQGENYYDLSIRDLYSDTFSKTMGSHVTLYNVESFGNVFFNYVFEYFVNSSF